MNVEVDSLELRRGVEIVSCRDDDPLSSDIIGITDRGEELVLWAAKRGYLYINTCIPAKVHEGGELVLVGTPLLRTLKHFNGRLRLQTENNTEVYLVQDGLSAEVLGSPSGDIPDWVEIGDSVTVEVSNLVTSLNDVLFVSKALPNNLKKNTLGVFVEAGDNKVFAAAIDGNTLVSAGSVVIHSEICALFRPDVAEKLVKAIKPESVKLGTDTSGKYKIIDDGTTQIIVMDTFSAKDYNLYKQLILEHIENSLPSTAKWGGTGFYGFS